MEECDHNRTTVTDSRNPLFVNSKGVRAFDDLLYPCLVIRRRKCSDCNNRFSTVEIPKEFMDLFEKSQKSILELANEAKNLSDFLMDIISNSKTNINES